MAVIMPIAQTQYGALPYLLDENRRLKVLLVTTRGNGHWVIPKGWPMRKLSAADTAAREAYEEAGVVGSVVGDAPIGTYLYQKRQNTRKPELFEVSVYLFAVERQLRKWPEKTQRDIAWFDPAEASALVGPAGLAQILQTIEAHPLISGF